MTNENGNIFRYLSEMSKENILCARTEFNKQGKPRPEQEAHGPHRSPEKSV